MGRKTVTLTPAWALVSSVKCIITINETKNAAYINDAASDTNAYRDVYEKGAQYSQTEVKDTYMRCESGTLDIIVDEEG